MQVRNPCEKDRDNRYKFHRQLKKACESVGNSFSSSSLYHHVAPNQRICHHRQAWKVPASNKTRKVEWPWHFHRDPSRWYLPYGKTPFYQLSLHAHGKRFIGLSLPFNERQSTRTWVRRQSCGGRTPSPRVQKRRSRWVKTKKKSHGAGVSEPKTFPFCSRWSYLKSSCLTCDYCVSGKDVFCRERVLFPGNDNNNGFADGVVVDSR